MKNVLFLLLLFASPLAAQHPPNHMPPADGRIVPKRTRARATAPTIAVTAAQAANYTDSSGQVWVPQTQCKNGSKYLMAPVQTIGGTLPAAADQKLYNSEYFGASTCTFPVANGSYTVLVKFAEIWYGSSNSPCTTCTGQRVFNMSINGAPALTSYDVVAAAGGPLKAIDQSFNVNVTTGSIVVAFTAASTSPDSNAKFDAISITPSGVGPPPPPPPTGSSITFSGTTLAGAAGSVTLDPTKAISALLSVGGGVTITGAVTPQTIASIAPNTGPAGTTVTITGTGFAPNSTVTFTCPSKTGTVYPAPVLSQNGSTSITVALPALPASATLPSGCDATVNP